MSIGRVPIYHAADGRLRGCYVYMLMCQDDGPIYIKIGMSEVPTKRLAALRTGCAVTPHILAIVELPSRDKAKLVEVELHAALKKWRTVGEWFRFSEDEKPQFNQAWKEVFDHFSKPSWPLKWEKIAIAPLVALAEQRKRFFKHRFKRNGRAHRDFMLDSKRGA